MALVAIVIAAFGILMLAVIVWNALYQSMQFQAREHRIARANKPAQQTQGARDA